MILMLKDLHNFIWQPLFYGLQYNHITYNLKIMLTSYLFQKMAQAKYKILEDGNYFGEIPGLQGVWASEKP